jgi:hypothetical protein
MTRINTFIAALLLTASLMPTVTVAQAPPANLPYHTIFCRFGAAPGDTGPGQACPFGTIAAALTPLFPVNPTAPGIDQNVLNNQTGNYTIAPTDCGATVFYGTVGQFTLTLPSVSGFPSNCSVLVKNGDTVNGKILSGFPSSLGTLLYPRQNFGVKIVNGAWTPFYYPAPYAPISAVTFFVSPSGVDTNDGLTAGTPITFATACQRRQTIFQPGAVTIQLADGTYSTAVGGVLCSVLGNSGGNSQTLTNITGNCGATSNVVLSIPDGDTGIQVKDLGEVEVGCIKFQGAGSGVSIGVSAAQFSVVDFQTTTWGTFGAGSVFVSMAQSASFNLIGTAAMTLLAPPGSGGTVISLASSANMSVGAATIAIPSALAWGGQFLQMYGPTMATLGGLTFTGSGVAGTTGKRASLIGTAFLVTAGVPCNTFFPGNGACTLIQGAQDDAGDPQTTPTPQAQVAIANLPTCNSAAQGALAYVTNGVASPTYRASVSTTGSTFQLVGCDGSGWTYH